MSARLYVSNKTFGNKSTAKGHWITNKGTDYKYSKWNMEIQGC